MSRWVIAYDVADDDTRLRVAARLGREGMRIQYSVFDVSAVDIDALLADIVSEIDENTDRVHALPRCPRCLRGTREIGQTDPGMDAYWWIA